MENYYEELGLDTTASLNDIKKAIQQKSDSGTLDESKGRKIRSILLNELAKPIYDKRLAESLIDENNTKEIITSGYQSRNLYIYAFFVGWGILLILGYFLSKMALIGANIVIGIVLIILLFLDWDLLAKEGKANFPKWWALFYPVYLFKRNKKFGLFFIGILLTNYLFSGMIWANNSNLEESSCATVSDIYKSQFHINNVTCKKVTITNNNGDSHEAIAEMSNGTVRNITIKEVSDGQIYVQIQPLF